MELLVDAHDLGPGLLKEAGITTPLSVRRYDIPDSAELAKLANSDFAVVMVGGGKMFRKFACSNPGVAWLNAHYLADVWDDMPKTAAAVAGMRLLEAMEGLTPPPALLEKMAQTIHPHPENGELIEVDGIQMVDIEKTAWAALAKGISSLGRHAMTAGKNLMRTKGVSKVVKTPGKMRTTEYAGKGFKDWGKYHGGKALAGVGKAVAKNPLTSAGVAVGAPTAGVMLAKSASETPAPLLNGKYPVETREQVKQASEFFDKHWKRLHPADRRQYCSNLMKAAAAHQLTGFSDKIVKYAGEAISGDVLLHLKVRGDMVDDRGREVLTKLAEAIPYSDPDSLGETLTAFDEHYGLSQKWDESLPDPYMAVCTEKQAEAYVWMEGVDRVTEDGLNQIRDRDIGQIKQTFGEDVAHQFVKNPVTVFKSLPDPQKRIVARLANSSSTGGTVAG